MPSGSVEYYYGRDLIYTPEDRATIVKLFGEHEYMFHKHWFDESFNTGLPDVLNLLAVIQNTPRLNERDTALQERIAKGLTYSTAYYSNYVEENLLIKLVNDARTEYNKCVENTDRINSISVSEFFRIYGIPHKSVYTTIEESIKKIGEIPEPPQRYDVKFHWPMFKDGQTVFKEYYIEEEKFHWLRFNKEGAKQFYSKHPYLAKLYHAEDYIQVYVYDYHTSDNALQNVLHSLYTK